jgi:23S rRNA-/tRNA-specific pseudouridylate synthase
MKVVSNVQDKEDKWWPFKPNKKCPNVDCEIAEKKLASEGIKLLYFDTYWLVASKPSGITTTIYKQHQSLQEKIIEAGFTDYAPAHNLDLPTSGIVAGTFPGSARSSLHTQIMNRKVTKIYTALLEGILDTDEVIDQPLSTSRHVTVDKNGKTASTEVYPVENYKHPFLGDVTLAAIKINTGRKHQIRVHCSHIDHPVVGDKRYGNRGPTLMMLHSTYFEVPNKTLSFTPLQVYDRPGWLKNEQNAGLDEIVLKIKKNI